MNLVLGAQNSISDERLKLQLKHAKQAEGPNYKGFIELEESNEGFWEKHMALLYFTKSVINTAELTRKSGG